MRFKEFLNESVQVGQIYSICTSPRDEFEKVAITKRQYDRNFLNGLKESVELIVGNVYVFTKPVQAHEFIGDDPNIDLGSTELGIDQPLDYGSDYRFKLVKLTEDEVWLKWADGHHNLWTYSCNREEFQNSVITEREYKKRWIDSLKEQTITEMPAKAGEGPRAVLQKIFKEECDKVFDKMPMGTYHQTAGYRRKSKTWQERVPMHKIMGLSSSVTDRYVSDPKGKKRQLKAFGLGWHRPQELKLVDYLPLTPLMREVARKFLDRVQNEAKLKIVGYNKDYRNQEYFNFSSFDLDAEVQATRGYGGGVEFFIEPSELLMTKRQVKIKIDIALRDQKLFKNVTDVDDIESKYDRLYRRRRDMNDESIVIVPNTFIDDIKRYAGDTEGESHLLSMIDPKSPAGKLAKEKIEAQRAKLIGDMPNQINRGRPALERLLSAASRDLEKIKQESPYEISIKITRPSDRTVGSIYRDVTKGEATKEGSYGEELDLKWLKNAEFIFIRIGDRKKSVSTDSVE